MQIVTQFYCIQLWLYHRAKGRLYFKSFYKAVVWFMALIKRHQEEMELNIGVIAHKDGQEIIVTNVSSCICCIKTEGVNRDPF